MSEISSPDAIIILGKKLEDDGSPPDELVERVKKALEFGEESDCHVIASGGFRNERSPLSEARVIKDQLVERGVEQDRIIMEEKSRDLVGNSYFSLKICGKNAWKDIVVVTASYNKARTKYIFKKVFDFKYNLSFSGVKIDSKLKLLEDWLLLLLTKLVLGRVLSEGDEKIKNFLQRWHPFYKRIDPLQEEYGEKLDD